ncbi:hypothetical protein NITHO_130002 [Nitrolancea hollandica Lb]|uniref:Uncharacterized protein n=1 Tax=Nitrolancea hollandica Lb TaxID=1129897 RepID=I4ED01_9BACT|nr:hypothetical protein NITHO_130002 [Nitrolancea hollandica Lb]
MIGGEGAHDRVAVVASYERGAEADGRSGAAGSRFNNDVVLRNLGKLAADGGGMAASGDHVHVLTWDDRKQAVNRGLEHRPRTGQRQQELWFRRPAGRPEPRSTPTRRDHRMDLHPSSSFHANGMTAGIIRGHNDGHRHPE